MSLLKQSTAYTRTFLLVASSDHLSALTGATATVNLSKAGGAFAAAGGTVTEIANGWYKVALTTTDTNTLGDLAFHITATSADPTDFADQVVAFDPGDSAALGLSRIDAAISSRMATFALPTNFASLVIDASGRVDLGKWIGVAPAALSATNGYVQSMLRRWLTDDVAGTPNALASGRVDAIANAIANGIITASTFAANALDAVWSTATRTLTAFGFSVTVGTNNDKAGYSLTTFVESGTAQAGAAGSITLRSGAVATDSFFNDQVVVLTGGTGAGQARRISAYVGATKVASIDTNWQTTPDATSTYVIVALGRTHVNVSDDKTGYALTAGEHTNIASDAQTGLTSQGYTATRAGYLDTLNGLVAAIWSAATRTLTSATGIAADIAADVWNAVATSYNTAGSMGAKLNAAGGSADPWATALPGAYGAGTAGAIVGGLPGSAWDVAIASHTSAGSTGNKLNSLSGASGSGALTVTLTIQNDGTHPVAGAQVWITTDVGGTNIVASGTTDTFGHLTVFLNAGTYYGFAAKPGENFTNPQALAVS